MQSWQEHEHQLRTDGFCIIEGVIPDDACKQVKERLVQVAHRCQGKNNPDLVSFVPSVINYDQSFATYIADPRILVLAEKLLGVHVRISFTSVIINEPGKPRTNWHADWPFNQNNACHVPAPYPNRVMHLTSLLMVSPFTQDNGGTLIVPGSHHKSSNPTDKNLGVDPMLPYPTELRVIAPAGSMVLFDSRLWHCPPANPSTEPRVALAIRYAPWWLNLEALDPDSEMRKQMVDEPGLNENTVPRIKRTVYESLPLHVQPLYRHWVERNNG